MNIGKKPAKLFECFELLDEMLKNSPDLEWFKTTSEDEVIAESHHGLGSWIRNNWGLANKKGELYEYFKKLGLKHPDDMSGVILTSYHRQVSGAKINLSSQVRECINFWNKQKNQKKQ